MSTEIIAIAVGIVLVWLIFTWLIKVFQASVSAILSITIVLLILRIFFGIQHQQIWQELTQIWQRFFSQ